MQSLDHLRAEIREAVARANPIEDARRSIELIAETSVRMTERDGETRVHVIDDHAERRTKTLDGREVEFTLDDLIAEIRAKHPSLFKREALAQPVAGAAAEIASAAAPTPIAMPVASAPMPGPAAEAAAAHAMAAATSPVAAAPIMPPAATLNPPMPPAAPAPAASRDWLDLGGAPASTVAPALAPAAAAHDLSPDLPRAPRVEGASDEPRGRGWFQMLGNAGPVIRIASNGMASRLSGFAANMRAQGDHMPGTLRATGEGLRRVAGPVLRTSAALVLLLIGGSVVYGLGSLAFGSRGDTASRTAVATPREPTTTGSISPTKPQPAPRPAATAVNLPENGPLRGVPEVLDTATLSIHGKVIRLFGIEWVRGAGEPSDLASYIRGREVICEPAKSGATYRCAVEGQDLSKVVLYNGGGRATAEATPDLTAAEAHAKSSRAGLWAKGG